jgi:cytoskeletal protein CcmA (bactofilin family)
MFLKNNNKNALVKTTGNRRESIPSIITQDINVLGNIVSEGNIDFDGTLNGNIRCNTLTIRAHGVVKGEVVAENLHVYGKVKGLIRAKNVQLYASCNVEGIIMHETVSIEDGAFVDGKFKRTDKPKPAEGEGDTENAEFKFDESNTVDSKILENIRLIR